MLSVNRLPFWIYKLYKTDQCIFYASVWNLILNFFQKELSNPAVFLSLVCSLGEHSRLVARCFLTLNVDRVWGSCKVICFLDLF